MSLQSGQVETITVDSYGTLVDPLAAKKELAEHVENRTLVSNLWRTRSIMYAMISNFIGEYQSFWEMLRDALDYALEYHGADVTREQRKKILSVYHELDVYEDVRYGMQALSETLGFPVYVLSNGSPEMLESMVSHAGINDWIEDLISVHEIRTFKPHPDVYRHAAARTGTPINRIAHVAGPGFDIQGAVNAGMQGVWVNRSREPWEAFGPQPDLEVSSFVELAETLS